MAAASANAAQAVAPIRKLFVHGRILLCLPVVTGLLCAGIGMECPCRRVGCAPPHRRRIMPLFRFLPPRGDEDTKAAWRCPNCATREPWTWHPNPQPPDVLRQARPAVSSLPADANPRRIHPDRPPTSGAQAQEDESLSVAAIAPGEMGAKVGGRLVVHGLKVMDSADRPQHRNDRARERRRDGRGER